MSAACPCLLKQALRTHSPPRTIRTTRTHSPSVRGLADVASSSLHRTSPASKKRGLKPSAIAPTQQNAHLATPSELPALQPATPAQQEPFASPAQPQPAAGGRKRKSVSLNNATESMASASASTATSAKNTSDSSAIPSGDAEAPTPEPQAKKSRTNTPWTPTEELRLKQMRDAGNSWSEIAKVMSPRCVLARVIRRLAPNEQELMYLLS